MSERGSYRSIPNALLAGPDFRRLPERARWIFVVLKMNMGPVGIDVWYPDELAMRLSQESGATPDQVRLALDILEHEGWVRRHDNIIWAVGHLEHDPHFNAQNRKHRASVLHHLAGLPRTGIVRDFISAHPTWILAEEARGNGLGWAFERVSNGKRKPIRKSGNGYPMGIATHSIQEEEKEEEEEKDSFAPQNGAERWPSSWAGDTSALLLEQGVVESPGVIGKHTKPVKDTIPWSEWQRIVVRLAKAGDCAYGWPQALRRVRDHRDAVQPDPNRDLSLAELEEMAS